MGTLDVMGYVAVREVAYCALPDRYLRDLVRVSCLVLYVDGVNECVPERVALIVLVRNCDFRSYVVCLARVLEERDRAEVN